MRDLKFGFFNRLADILSPYLCRKVNITRAMIPITKDLIVAIGIRYLSGEKIRSFKDLCRDMLLDALLEAPELDIVWPTDRISVRQGFCLKSTYGMA